MKKSSSTPAAVKSASSSSHAKAAAAKCTPSTSRGKKSEKTTDPKGKPEIWRCEMCEVDFVDDESNMLECEVCELHYCHACLKLSDYEYEFLSKR